jgi:thymidylate kinase
MQVHSAMGKLRTTSGNAEAHGESRPPETKRTGRPKEAKQRQAANVESPGKAVIRSFLESLDAKGVRFCHWKSNIRLGDTLAGIEDIDLLVHRGDAKPFHESMLENGFKLAQSRAGVGHPGVFHALSLDAASGELAHLHAYHQIVSGDSLVKNYRLKIEDMLLNETSDMHGVKVPSREAELVLFALRIALKHVSLIEIMMVNRHYRAIADEMEWLSNESDPAKAAALCATFFPTIEPAIFQQLLDAIINKEALVHRVILGWRVAWRLRDKRRLAPVRASMSRLWRVLSLVLGRLRHRKDLALQTGGLIVALVGPKATGKSTLSSALAIRLGSELNVHRIHAGKPPATALTLVTRALIPIARLLFRNERPSQYQKPERRRAQQFSLLYVFHMTLLAYERQRLLRGAFRMAAAGDIVVSDRYPSASTGAIDSSCFDDAAVTKCGSALKRLLMNIERAIYKGMPKPDLVIRLVAPMDTAIQRDAKRLKPGGPDSEAVQRRWMFETQADYFGMPVFHIDTNRPIDETIRDVVATVWAAL